MTSEKSNDSLEMPVFDGPVKLLIVVAPYFKDITDSLLAGAQNAINAAGAGFDTVQIPGVLEIPAAIAIAQRTSNFDGYVALGCVLTGDDLQAKNIGADSAAGLSQLGLGGICIGNGLLIAQKADQALRLADPAGQNKGGAAAIAALHLVALSRKWGRETKGIGFKPKSGEFLMADSPDSGPKTA